ncbi:putative PIN domain protein [Fibrella aestuarina BUZ 2]|uniref:Putative PIN domain protein n=1 Tax=Fibrella aestuarina BUZ 2 TaxID=1166018 RepID=I0K663_9BACT|nr:PIN domain-containing protein [Fibrella aestuarina]CCG99616.1 putative PIN domain protein [Fibrella aestuarina BUZ 2]
MDNQTIEMCVSETVLSEFAFYWIAIAGEKAPATLKRDGTIGSILTTYSPRPILDQLTFLASSPTIVPLYLRYMQQYNLLPNDALILATCKLHRISRLASYDADFGTACAGEGIQLIQQIADLTA